MKHIVLFLAIVASLNAKVGYNDALFGCVVGVNDWDTLNVRVSPNYKSKKIGLLPNDKCVGIDKCKKIDKSLWCKVHHMANYDFQKFENNARSGWVNARYLKLSDNGYVLINGIANCYYIMDCKNGLCSLVTDYKQDKYHNITSIETKKVKRSSLYAESRFGAMMDCDGHCEVGNSIYYYLRRKNQSSKSALSEFLDSITLSDKASISYYISQKIGIKISDKPYIDNQKAIPKDKFMGYFGDNTEIIPKYYGGKDIKNPTKIDLYTFLHTLYKGGDKVSKIDKKVISENEVEYIVYRNLNDTHNYHGMVVRLKKIDSRWYVISIAHKQSGS